MLKVPFYEETTNYSCGAASALMILRFFKKIKLTRKNEFELWKEALALPFKFSSVEGLASLIARRKLKVTVITKVKKPTFSELKIPLKYENISKNKKKEDLEYYKFYKNIQLTSAKQAGVKFISRKPILADVIASLKNGQLVLILIDDWWLRKFIWKDDLNHVIHWIVAIGFETGFISVVDPAYGKIKIPIKAFQKLMNLERHIKMQSAIIKVSK